jgi:tetratricopeptide (TPR) repeat protein
MQLSPSKLLTGVALLVTIVIASGCTAQMRKARYAEQAERYFKAGQYDEAKIEYLKLLRVDPRNAVAYGRMGEMWLEENSPLRAGGFLAAALKYDEKDVATRVRLARAYALIGQPAAARKQAEMVLKQSPDNGEGLLMLTETSRTPEDRAAAEQEIQRFPQQQGAFAQLARGTVALQKSNQTAAQDAFKQAVATEPKLPQVHVAMAVVLLAKRDIAGAEGELKTAADLAPTRSRERLNYAEFKTKVGATEEAKNYLKNLTAQARDFIGAWTLQAKIAVAEKQFDQAVALLENVFSRDPDDLDARVLRAQIYLAQNDPKKAVEILDHLDKSFPNSPSIKYQLALAYLKSGNSAQAISELEQAVAVNKNYPEATLLLAQLNLRAGKTQAAIDPLVSLVKNRPELVQAQTLLADAFLAAGRGDEAASIIREQIKRSSEPSQPYLMLGLILLRQKKTDEARQAFERAVQWDKNNVLAIDQLVSLDLNSKNYAAARQRAEQLLQQDPQSAAGYFMKGKVDLAEGKRETGEAFVKKAIELNPNLAPAYDLLVQSYLSAGKLQEALQEIDVIVTKNPKAITALTLAGLLQERLNDFQKARDNYEKVLAINANAVVVLNNLANIYAEKLGDIPRAAELARKAHDLAPAEPTISDTLGWILYKQGDYEHASELLEESGPKLADNPEAQFHLGMARYMMGQLESARAPLEKAAAAVGDFPWKEEAKRRLALLAGDNSAATNLPPAELEKIAREKSNDPIALIRLGTAYEKQGAADKAADAYQRAFQANPRLPEAALKLAQVNVDLLKNNPKALEYARKARDLAPTDPHITAAIGQIAYEAGNFSWAYSLLQESARQIPDDAGIAYALAWAAYSLGNVTEAQQAMQRAVDKPNATNQQQDAKRFLTMIQLDFDDRDPARSQGEVDNILAADPKYIPALMARADIQLRRNDAKSATTVYTGILQRFPDFAPAQKRLAGIYAEDPANAEKGYELANKARRTLPDDPVLASTLGRLNFQRKDYARAVQLLEEADRKKPLDGKSLFCLGMAHLQLGHKAEAKPALERALSGGLSEPLAAQTKAKIAELEKTSQSH